MASDDGTLFGLNIAQTTMTEVVSRCRDALNTRSRLMIGVVNAAKIVNSRSDDLLLASLVECDIILADGQSVVWASTVLGHRLPERIAGIDLFERLLSLADQDGRSVYLLGARSEVLARLQDTLHERFPRLEIAGARDGYFDDAEGANVAQAIRESGADMLFLGMVTPKKEIFLAAHGESLGVPILHGVGGSFDVLAGITKRAPVRWQRMGLEWAYRLLQEPRRMWRRYFRTNLIFVWLVVRELVKPTPALARKDTVPNPGRQP